MREEREEKVYESAARDIDLLRPFLSLSPSLI